MRPVSGRLIRGGRLGVGGSAARPAARQVNSLPGGSRPCSARFGNLAPLLGVVRSVTLPPFELPAPGSKPWIEEQTEPAKSASGNHPADAYQQAWSLLEASSPKKALEILAPAIEAEPGSASLRTLRAWAYFQSAQLNHAEAELRTLVEQNPTDLWARFALGRVLERQSRYAEALPHLRLAAVMSGDPEHETGVLRCERKLAEIGSTSYDDLS